MKTVNKDYRITENRLEYFTKLYKLNLDYGIMPGLVYLYMPELASRNQWNAEQRLWFAFLNGMTQNPITSLVIFEQLPEVPSAKSGLLKFDHWFNSNWKILQFDTDRRHQKRDTVEAIKVYARLVKEYGSQKTMLSGKTYTELWNLVYNHYFSFGRLSSFSYLEYVFLNGYGADCNNLLFEDKSGSKSHRNGMLFLLGQDHLVWDKRQKNSHDGNYPDFKTLCKWLNTEAEKYLKEFTRYNSVNWEASKFTLESNLCTFKNHFFGRRYPGVYADMAWERIEKAEACGNKKHTEIFKDIRQAKLPTWLRIECETKYIPKLKERAEYFPKIGIPYRGQYFL